MTIDQQVVEKLRGLSLEQKKRVLSFLDTLKKDAAEIPAKHSLLGLWEDLNCHITEEDIAEVRREMWGNFPREIKP